MYATVIFLGINNCSAVQQYVTTERTVMYRERFVMREQNIYFIFMFNFKVDYMFILGFSI